MNDSLSIHFGTPKHGWLPVDLHYNDFHLELDASNVLNDPIHELIDILLNLQNNTSGEIAWWLEPGAYFFNLSKHDSIYSLIISFTYDLHPDEGEIEKEEVRTISGNYNQLIEPILNSLIKFCSQEYEKKHWSYKIAKSKLDKLFANDF